jgi:hypothetical protein
MFGQVGKNIYIIYLYIALFNFCVVLIQYSKSPYFKSRLFYVELMCKFVPIRRLS